MLASGSGSKSQLEFSRVRERTVIRTARAESPLRFLTPKNQGRAAWVYTTTLGGGLVAGDRIALDVDLGEAAEAVLLTQSSTKVYRGEGASVSVQARVGKGSSLVVIPDPTVCFEGSAFSQTQVFDLAEDASALVLDTFTSGRHATGERWKFERLSSRIEVRRRERPIFLEALSLDRAGGHLADRMGRFNALAVALLIGPAWRTFGESLRAKVERSPLACGEALVLSASFIGEDGTLLRAAGVSTERVSLAIRELLAFLPDRLGDNPWTRRG